MPEKRTSWMKITTQMGNFESLISLMIREDSEQL